LTYSANSVADTLISLSRQQRGELTNLKLQKLLYYSQAWHLVLRGRPLFSDAIEAWVHGPVVPAVFRRFRDFRWKEIDCPVAPVEDPEMKKHLGSVLDVYGGFTATQLESLTHRESPWLEARAGLESDMPSQKVISHKAMHDFYLQQVVSK
jgi:uncharacterized phage-associated protein